MSEEELSLEWDAVEVEGDSDSPEAQDNPEHGTNQEAEMDEEAS